MSGPLEPITIRLGSPQWPNAFVVEQGDRQNDGLNWDEMVGQVAGLTHPQLRKPHYPMLTPEESAERERQLAVRRARSPEQPVAVAFSREQAERLQQGLADLLCWCRGYIAATVDDFGQTGPIGVQACRDLNIALKRAIDDAERSSS